MGESDARGRDVVCVVRLTLVSVDTRWNPNVLTAMFTGTCAFRLSFSCLLYNTRGGCYATSLGVKVVKIYLCWKATGFGC